jgi:hypothetical protein
MVVRWGSRRSLKRDDAFDDDVEIVRTTIESNKEPGSEKGGHNGD